MRRHFLEAQAGRQRDAFAERQHFAGASEGTNDNRLAAASDTAERSSAWSRSLARRIVNRVLHWEMMVASSSAGRCVTSPR